MLPWNTCGDTQGLVRKPVQPSSIECNFMSRLTGNDGARPDFNGEWSGTGYEFKHFTMHRHGKGIQVVFFDGSARQVRARNLWRLQWHKSFDINYADNQGANFFPAWMR